MLRLEQCIRRMLLPSPLLRSIGRAQRRMYVGLLHGGWMGGEINSNRNDLARTASSRHQWR